MVATPLFYIAASLPPDYMQYVGRKADEEAYDFMRVSTPISITAARQTGKTSLLRRLQGQLTHEGWSCAYVDLSILHRSTCDKLIQRIATKVVDAANLSEPLSLPRDPAQFYDFMYDLLCRSQRQLKLALLLDEIDVFADMDFAADFWIHIRALYPDSYPRLCFALCGQQLPSSFIRDPTISPLNLMIPIALSDYTSEKCRVFTQALDLIAGPLTRQAHDRIYYWTAGHPYLVQRLCVELERRLRSLGIFVDQCTEIDAAVHDVFLSDPDLDANMTHVRRAVGRLKGQALTCWRKLLVDGEVKSSDLGYINLRDTGVLHKIPETNISHWRNRIYQELLQTYDPIPPTTKSPPAIKPAQIKVLQTYFAEAFTSDELAQVVYYSLGERIESIATGNVDHVVFRLLMWAYDRGLLRKLIQYAVDERPANPPPGAPEWLDFTHID